MISRYFPKYQGLAGLGFPNGSPEDKLVRLVQQALIRCGTYKGNIDGDFGVASWNALKQAAINAVASIAPSGSTGTLSSPEMKEALLGDIKAAITLVEMVRVIDFMKQNFKKPVTEQFLCFEQLLKLLEPAGIPRSLRNRLNDPNKSDAQALAAMQRPYEQTLHGNLHVQIANRVSSSASFQQAIQQTARASARRGAALMSLNTFAQKKLVEAIRRANPNARRDAEKLLSAIYDPQASAAVLQGMSTARREAALRAMTKEELRIISDSNQEMTKMVVEQAKATNAAPPAAVVAALNDTTALANAVSAQAPTAPAEAPSTSQVAVDMVRGNTPESPSDMQPLVVAPTEEPDYLSIGLGLAGLVVVGNYLRKRFMGQQ